MIGGRWANVPGYEKRGECTTCGTIEDMNHIILNCGEAAVNIVWEQTKTFWPHDEAQWPELNIGTIMGCACLKVKWENEAVRNGREWSNETQNVTVTEPSA